MKKKYKFGTKGIRSANIDRILETIDKLQAKIDDPNDKDDKKWLVRWLKRANLELDKKQKALELKLDDKT